jgi:hypothetical protein
MISMSKGRKGEALHAVVIVAFDRANGRVHGTFVHGSLGGPDDAGVKRSRERLMMDLRDRLGGAADLDTVQLPLDELKENWIERVDPATRQPVKRARDASIRITRP